MPLNEAYSCTQCVYIRVKNDVELVCIHPTRDATIISDDLIGHAFCHKFALDYHKAVNKVEDNTVNNKMKQSCYNCLYFTNHSDQDRCYHPETPRYVIPGDASECPEYVNKTDRFATFEEQEPEKITPPKKRKNPQIGARKIKYD